MRVEPEAKTTDLIPLEAVNAAVVFSGTDGLYALLNEVRAHVEANRTDDVSTEAGRKAIASLAYKVARSKTTLDDAGKALVADWKKQARVVDDLRVLARDFLDALKDSVRKPLTDWETEQARIEEERRQAEEAEAERIAEAERAAQAERERALAEREAEVKRKEDEQRAREKADREEAERKARDERIRKETEERVAREARDKAEREQAAADRRAANERHRAKTNAAAVAALVDGGIGERTAEKAVELIIAGAVPRVSINY